MLESVIRTEGDYYYLQTFVEECKYEVKNIKRSKCIDFMTLIKTHLINQIVSMTAILIFILIVRLIVNLESLLRNLIIINLESLF